MKNRITSVLLLVCMLITFALPINAMAASKPNYGDVNLSGTINADDALEILKHAAKIDIIDEVILFMADVNVDKLVDASDALDVLKYSADLIDSFICQKEDEEGIFEDDFSGDIWILGDSIAAKHEKTASVRPLYGWGEVIGDYLVDGVTINNHGISSQSTSSYYNLCKSTYDYVMNGIKENDYVFISYGHNDHNTALLNGFNRITDPYVSTDTEYSFRWWLKNYYIDPVLEKGGVPILMSSVVRCTYEKGAFVEEDIHLDYSKAMKQLVDEYAQQGITINYIDATTYTYNLYSGLSYDEASLYHGKYGGEASHFFDNTHYSEAGARMISQFIIDELKKTDLSITKYIK